LDAETPAPIAELNASARHLRTACGNGHMGWRVWGEGPAVVLLHGNHGSWTHWLKTIPALAPRYRLIVPDRPGFGESDLPPEPYSVENITRILADGLKEILRPGENADFVGFSFGSQFAAGCALTLHDRARKVVLVGSTRIGISREDTERPVGWRRLATQAERDAAHRRNLEIVMFADPAKIDELAVRVQRDNAQNSRLRSDRIASRPTISKVLEEAGCEVCGVWGERDPRFFPHERELFEKLETITPDAKFVVLRGAGHWLMYEAPERANQALLGLLDRSASPLFDKERRVVL
jgi:pimeloyl-ACP methyl ester carboxylesterase